MKRDHKIKEGKKMRKSKQPLAETYARLFKGRPASNDHKLLREAVKYDVEAAIRAIRNYNRSGKSNEELENLAISIVKDLGFKPTGNNVDNVMVHLVASAKGEDRIPEDAAMVKELYPMLEAVS